MATDVVTTMESVMTVDGQMLAIKVENGTILVDNAKATKTDKETVTASPASLMWRCCPRNYSGSLRGS